MCLAWRITREFGYNPGAYEGPSLWDCLTALDVVDPGTAGGLKLHRLMAAAKKNKWNRIMHACEILLNKKAFENILIKKDQEKCVMRRSDAIYRNHWEKLLEYEIMERLAKDAHLEFCSTYFAVPKSESKSRSIFNGKRLSRLFEAPPPVNLMDAPRLIKKVAEWHDAYDGKIHVVNGDLRHWFHQIPLNHEVRNFFGLTMDKMNVRWKVLPMGWSWSPYLAQALAYGFLAHYDEEKDEYPHVDGTNLGDEVLPHYLPLQDEQNKMVGFVTVYYDNYFILSTDAKVARTMKERLEKNADRLHALIKEGTHRHTTPEQLRAVEDGVEVGFEHLGIKFFSRQENERWKLHWQLAPEKVAKREENVTINTMRDMAGVIGKCLYSHFISLEPLALRSEAGVQ